MRKGYWMMAAVAALTEVLLLGCGARIDQTGPAGGLQMEEVRGATVGAEAGEKPSVPESDGMSEIREEAAGRRDEGSPKEMGALEETQGGETQIKEAPAEEPAVCGYPSAWEMVAGKRMVMLDGKLYVETGETDPQPRCGVMDGMITSTTNGEPPTEDHQSNFGADIGYQTGLCENGIEIWLDDAWRVFQYQEDSP